MEGAAETSIRQFLSENFPLVRGAAVDRDLSLIEAGVIDSTGVLELVDFVEERFDVEISDEELVPENFDSIGNIVEFVTRKGAAGD